MDNSFLESYKKAKQAKQNQQAAQAAPKMSSAAADLTPSQSQSSLVDAPSTNHPADPVTQQSIPAKAQLPTFLNQTTSAPTNNPSTGQISGTNQNVTKDSKKTLLGNKFFIVLLAITIVLLSTTVLTYFVLHFKPGKPGSATANRPARSAVLGKEDDMVKEYTKEIGKMIDLPKEAPRLIAKISDVEKLRQQTTTPEGKSFFDEAKTGDIVLVYSNKAILYDPVKKVIVNVARADLTKAEILVSPSPTPEPVIESPTPTPTALPKKKPTKASPSPAISPTPVQTP